MKRVIQLIADCVERLQVFFTPRRILVMSFSVALLWGALFLLFNQDIYRDVAGCYAWYAREFGRGYWNPMPVAALPPLNIFLGGLLVRCGVEAYSGLMALAVFFYVLTILPLYGILSRLATPRMAAWGCFLFVMTPKIIRFAGMGLLESTRDFFLVTSIYFLLRSRRGEFRWPQWIGMGVSLGLLSLARGEGVVMAVGLGIALLVRHRADYCRWRSLCRTVLLPALGVAMFALLTIAPCLAHNYKVTGYPVIDTRAIGVINQIPGLNKIFHDRRVVPVREYAPGFGEGETREGYDGSGAAALARLRMLPAQMMRGGYEFYMILAFCGIAALAWRRQWRGEYTFALIYCGSVSLVFCFFSVAYRYFIFLVPLLMVFTLHGIGALGDLAGKFRLKPVLFCVVGAIITIQPWNALGELIGDAGAKEIAMGNFLRENRARFLPPERAGDKLIIEPGRRVEILYWSDQARLMEYGERVLSWKRLRGFDVLIAERKDAWLLNMLRSRDDLQEFATPCEDYLLFTPKRQEAR
ncbi:MAG: ArnT family glycosyltransferase [Victivallaceae bacterium]